MRAWLTQNVLLIDPSTYEVMRFDCRRAAQVQNHRTTVSYAGTATRPSTAAERVDVTLYPQFTVDEHVVAICKACYIHIRVSRHIRNSLPENVAKTFASSIISSRLDYCNLLFLLLSISEMNLATLQAAVVQITHWLQSLRLYHASFWLDLTGCRSGR